MRLKDRSRRQEALQLQAVASDDRLQPAPPGRTEEKTQSHGEKAGKAVMGHYYSPELARFWKTAILIYAVFVVACFVVGTTCFAAQVASSQREFKGTEVTTHEEVDWQFQPRALEAKWLNDSYNWMVSKGAGMLCCAAFGYIVFRAIRFERRSHGSCLPVYWPLAGGELVFLTLVMGLAFYTANRPGASYWIVLGAFFFYTLAWGLPPFSFSCSELVAHCFYTRDQYILTAARTADCTLEGYTAQQTIMTWILVFPWIVPRRSLMPMAWLWIIVVYGGWAYFYRFYFPLIQRTFSISFAIFHFAFLNLVFLISFAEKSFIERMQRTTFLADLRMREASWRLFQILECMVPVHVIAPMIKRPGEVIAEPVNRVSILFILIDGFDEIAESNGPAEVLAFLNKYFTKFDRIMEENRVTKIETVGEEYVACVGVMPEDVAENAREGHSKILGRLITAADQVLNLQTETVRFKMGLHSGPIVAGVIGSRLPRYRLFGDTINTAARLMQKGEVGQLQLGEETHKDLPDTVEVKQRGDIELKGKGQVKAFLIAPTLRPKRASMFAAMTGQDRHEDEVVEDSTYTYMPHHNAESRVSTAQDGAGAKGVFHFNAFEDKTDIKLHLAPHENFEKTLAETQDDADTDLIGTHYQDWKRWHHENKVCNKVTKSLDVQLMVLLLLAAFEGAYMVCFPVTGTSGLGVPANLRLPVFLGLRATVMGIILLWRLALSSNAEWVLESPGLIMWGRLATWVLIGLIIFYSYDDLSPNDVTEVAEHHILVQVAPFSQNFGLIFVLIYTIIMRIEGMLFMPSLVSVPLAIGLMVCSEFSDNQSIVGSFPAKVFFTVNQIMSCAVCYTDEQTSKTQYQAKIAMEATTSRVQRILSTLMPPLVLEELRNLPPGAQPTHTFKAATICQSDLCGFTALSSTRTPGEVVRFMGELFGRFDELTDTYGVYKVETVGDAYIAGVAEAPLTPTNSPVNVLLFGLAMIEAVHVWARKLGESVTCRVGVHHGECIGGVVGSGMQRYHLFGKLLCGIEIMESTAPEACVQVSPACKAAVEKEAAAEAKSLVFNQREEPHLKTSKGIVHEYESVGGRSFVVAYTGDASALNITK